MTNSKHDYLLMISGFAVALEMLQDDIMKSDLPPKCKKIIIEINNLIDQFQENITPEEDYQ